jgi:hypothetical protein
MAQIALHQPCHPAKEPQQRGLVQVHRLAQTGDGFGGGGLTQQDLDHIAGQHLGRGKDDKADNQQRHQRHADAAKDQGHHLSVHPGLLQKKRGRAP